MAGVALMFVQLRAVISLTVSILVVQTRSEAAYTVQLLHSRITAKASEMF